MRRAHHAQQLLNDPLLSESVWAIDSDLLEQMRQVKLDDHVAHSRLITALQVTQAIRRHLYRVLHEGFEAQQRIDLRGRRID